MIFYFFHRHRVGADQVCQAGVDSLCYGICIQALPFSRGQGSEPLRTLAVPPLGNAVEFLHYAIEFQHLLGDGVGDLRRDRGLVMPGQPPFGFEHSQPFG